MVYLLYIKRLFVTALIVFFTYLGEYNDYAIYKTKEDKVTLSEVVFAFNSLKIKVLPAKWTPSLLYQGA
ncbi:transmembrane regulator [Salmonella enterica subsp. enterica]|uniref:Transmembrane regulator n=1 Tax=Salmonella enterica I TaxID=59201 RepID=A0A447U9C7_SALET|nr:transmembrane regulator [Salmonella enterica subsp. enterica]